MLDRRLFGLSLTGLTTLLFGAATPKSKSRPQIVFEQLHLELCQGLINKTNGCIRTLHGCMRKSSPVYDDPYVRDKRGVYILLDLDDWAFFRKLKKDNPSSEIYAPIIGMSAYTDVKMTNEEWKEVLFLFRQAYPAP
jgi:hypothetical protein